MANITSEIVLAYANCPRKAHSLLFDNDRGKTHEYVEILERQALSNRAYCLAALREQNSCVVPYSVEALKQGSALLTEAKICAPRSKRTAISSPGSASIQPSVIQL